MCNVYALLILLNTFLCLSHKILCFQLHEKSTFYTLNKNIFKWKQIEIKPWLQIYCLENKKSLKYLNLLEENQFFVRIKEKKILNFNFFDFFSLQTWIFLTFSLHHFIRIDFLYYFLHIWIFLNLWFYVKKDENVG